MLPRFYYPALPTTSGDIDLPAEITHHAVNVLRLGRDALIILFDGQGREAAARIVNADRHHLQVTITQITSINRETPVRVTLVQALPSGDKMDWVVEKCTELGIGTIQPVQAARSVVKLSGERAEKKRMRWQDIAISACAQCGRNVVPEIRPILPFNAWLSRSDSQQRGLRLLMDLAPDIARLSRFDFSAHTEKNISVLVGPEGAFTDEEIQHAQAAGFHAINLGARILRTETAGLAFMAALNVLRGDF